MYEYKQASSKVRKRVRKHASKYASKRRGMQASK